MRRDEESSSAVTAVTYKVGCPSPWHSFSLEEKKRLLAIMA